MNAISGPSPTVLKNEIQRRRTFAIISHPDAGKTTLTEKLLLYGGAIHLAGAVKAKKNQRHTSSDWMELEKQRGISISTTVLQFEYENHQINLLDTPGHKDFSEDTYRTLMAADAAVMLIDAAKGVEPQTRKLFEVCRLRGIPIFTFINKLDRPSREPLDLIDELEKILGIRSCPITWPIGLGDEFRGVYNRMNKEIQLYQKQKEANIKERLEPHLASGADDPFIASLLSSDPEEAKEKHQHLQTELELLEHAGDPYDADRVLKGQLSPVFFGSALNNFGVQSFLDVFLTMAPPPTERTLHQKKPKEEKLAPDYPYFSGFVFKIQANMDPAHRDRVAFVRICSGQFRRNLEAIHFRLKKKIKLSMPLQFFGQERKVIEVAWPGDVIGILDTTGSLRIGDTLLEKGSFEFEKVPSFSPEHFAGITLLDPLKRKQLKKGLDQLAEEGVVQVYIHPKIGDRDPVLGAVGALQLEVLQFRLKSEYGVDTRIDRLPYVHARWVGGATPDQFFEEREDSRVLLDQNQKTVILFKSDWALRWTETNRPELQLLMTAPF